MDQSEKKPTNQPTQPIVCCFYSSLAINTNSSVKGLLIFLWYIL